MAKSKVRYVDGFVLVVPKKNLEAYRKMADLGRESWMRHGALDYKECVLDAALPGAQSTFKKLLKLKPGETAFFSYVGYRSKAHRDAVNKKVMKEFGKQYDKDFKMPMDMKRMTAAGFKVLVSN